MILSSLYLAGLLVALGALAVYRRPWLLTVWLVSFLVFPTTQVRVLGGPIYIYDIVALVVFGALLLCRDGLRWPRGIPRWHWWFIGLAFTFSVGFQIIRFGFLLDILWVWGHASIAWMAFAFAIVLANSRRREEYRVGLQNGFLIAAAALLAIASVQYLDLPGCEQIMGLFYGSIGSEKSVETLRRGLVTNRATGPHFAPTTLAGIALLSTLELWLVTDAEHRFRRWSMVAMAAATIAFTVSRHAVLAVVVGVAVIAWFSEGRRRARVVTGIVVCFLLIGIGASLLYTRDSWQYRLAKTEAGLLDDDNIAARLLWGPMRLAEFITRQPTTLLTGAGLESEKIAAHLRTDLENESGFVSNGFLLALYYLGVGGFLLFTGFWWWVFRLARRGPRPTRAVTTGFVAMAVVIIAADNYSFMYEPAVTLLFLLGGLVAGESRHHRLQQAAEDEETETAAEPRPELTERHAA